MESQLLIAAQVTMNRHFYEKTFENLDKDYQNQLKKYEYLFD